MKVKEYRLFVTVDESVQEYEIEKYINESLDKYLFKIYPASFILVELED